MTRSTNIGSLVMRWFGPEQLMTRVGVCLMLGQRVSLTSWTENASQRRSALFGGAELDRCVWDWYISFVFQIRFV